MHIAKQWTSGALRTFLILLGGHYCDNDTGHDLGGFRGSLTWHGLRRGIFTPPHSSDGVARYMVSVGGFRFGPDRHFAQGGYRKTRLRATVLNVDQYSLECGQVWSTQEHLVLPPRSPEFFSVFMSGNKFVFLLRKLSGCDSISSGVKEGVRESQRIGWYGKPYVRKRPATQLGARL